MMSKKYSVEKSRDEWKKELSEAAFRVLRKKGTEPAFNNDYFANDKPGIYHCAGCGQELFSSEDKYKSGSGWPSFTRPASKEVVETEIDNTMGMQRIEVHCSQCGGHLGHLFKDGPQPTGLRYCLNSAALDFIAEVNN